jgi:hypothetical protein
MASKLVTERGFRRERLSSSATNPHHHLREGPLGFDWFRPHLVDVRGSWIARRRKGRRAHFVAIRRAPATRPRSYRVEKRLVHVTPHPVHTALLVGPGQGMASLAEMLSGVLVL